MAKSKHKTRKVLIFSGLGVLIIGLALFAVFRKRDVSVPVQTEKVARRNLTELVVATGKIQPVTYVKISPEVSGEIIALPVKEGQDVKKGDLLMKIKPDTYIASTNSASAGFKAMQAQTALAKANMEKAQAELRRNDDLFKNNLVSDSQFLDVKTSFEVSKASHQSAIHQMDNAQAALDRALEDLYKTTIYSPLSGTISKLNSQLGERVVGTATYQGTEVMTISDLNDMEARVDIGEIDVVLIAVGQKARLEVDAFRDKKFTGVVSDIANTAKTSGTGSQQEATKFEVRIRIQEKAAFRPGMSVTAEIETRSRTNVLTVPIQCVTTRLPKEPSKTNALAKAETQPSRPGVQAADPPEKDKAAETNQATAKAKETNAVATARKPNEQPKPIEVVFLANRDSAKMVKVTRGISDDSYVEITDGIDEGQEVIVGTYKAINTLLEDTKKIKVDNTKKTIDKGDTKEEKSR